MSAITVYTTGEGCPQCRLTKRVMDAAGIPFREVDVTLAENAAAREYVSEELGYTSAPIVVVDDRDHWCGFRPDKIEDLAARLRPRRRHSDYQGPAFCAEDRGGPGLQM